MSWTKKPYVEVVGQNQKKCPCWYIQMDKLEPEFDTFPEYFSYWWRQILHYNFNIPCFLSGEVRKIVQNWGGSLLHNVEDVYD